MSLSEMLTDMATQTIERDENPNNVWGYPWEFEKLNDLTGGIHDTQVTLVVARTSEGKSSFLLQNAMAVLRQLKNDGEAGKVVIWTPEMSAKATLNRYIQQRTGIPSEKERKGTLSDLELQVWLGAQEALKEYDGRLEIVGQSAAHIDDIVAQLQEDRYNLHPTKLLVVDYIQYILGQGSGKYEQVTDVAHKLKQIANLHEIPVLAGAQANKQEKTQDTYFNREEKPRAPTLNDISDSQYPARVADNVLILWRPEDLWDGERAELRVAKQRDGENNRKVVLTYDKPTTTFSEQ